MKKLEWIKPVLVELGSARRMSFGEAELPCGAGTSVAEDGDGGNPRPT